MLLSLGVVMAGCGCCAVCLSAKLSPPERLFRSIRPQKGFVGAKAAPMVKVYFCCSEADCGFHP